MNAHDATTHGTNNIRPIIFALALAALAPYRTMALGPAPIDLGTSAPFAILAGSAITSTGGGDIYGDVGLSPETGDKIVGVVETQVQGVIYAVDDAGPVGSVKDPDLLTAAKNDLTTAYNNAKDRPPDPALVDLNGADIGGLNLAPGLYKFTAGALISSEVTLTGGPDDVWIFQIGSTLTVSSGVHVVLAGGAAARNIFWQVGSSATLGTFSDFKGTIMADQSITMDTSSTIEGRALAINGAVTFNGASITVPAESTLAVISAVRARVEDGVAIISWDVELEMDTVGYYLERWEEGDWLRVNADLILADIFDPEPKRYEQADPGAPLGGVQRYQIVELDGRGRLLTYGPYDLALDGGEISYETWAAGIDWGDADSSPDADPDEDGLTNAQERLAGTDPLNPNSVLKVTGIEPTEEGIRLAWQSEAGVVYAVEMALSLTQPYQPVASGIAATPPENHYVVPLNPDAAPGAFFRVVVGNP